MSGHSKWATTKHKKAIIDSRRAKVFAKQIRAIEVAARNGGADMDGLTLKHLNFTIANMCLLYLFQSRACHLIHKILMNPMITG